MDASGYAPVDATQDTKRVQDLFDALRQKGIPEVQVFREALNASSDPHARISARALAALGTFLRDVTSDNSDVRIAVEYAEKLLAGDTPDTPVTVEPPWKVRRANGAPWSGRESSHPIFTQEPLFPN